jgi:2-dehydropantoate 2-reductase
MYGKDAMDIAILGGGGAMGGLIGGSLQEAGHNVTLIDVSQDAINTINSKGLTIEQKSGESRNIKINASSDPSSLGKMDYIINFVKCYHTESAVSSAKPMMGANTTVLTLQNGWGNAPKIASIVGEEKVLVGVSYHSATLAEPGKVLHTGKGMTFVGELNGHHSERLKKITDALAQSGLEVTPTDNVLNVVWSKLALNACTLPTAALLKFYAHQLVEHEGTLELMRCILREVVAVANAQKIDLAYEERWEAITSLLKKAVGGKASMLQDVEKRRRTEIDVINGAIVEAGKRHNISTPYNDTVLHMVKALEETFSTPA